MVFGSVEFFATDHGLVAAALNGCRQVDTCRIGYKPLPVRYVLEAMGCLKYINLVSSFSRPYCLINTKELLSLLFFIEKYLLISGGEVS